MASVSVEGRGSLVDVEGFSDHVTSHSTIKKVHVTWTKRLVRFNLASERYIHFNKITMALFWYKPKQG